MATSWDSILDSLAEVSAKGTGGSGSAGVGTKCSIKPGDLSIQKGTERTFEVRWTVSGSKKDKVDKFEWYWQYKTSKDKNAKWINASSSASTTDGDGQKYSSYNAPDNAYAVRFKIRAKSKTYKVKEKVKDKNTGKTKTKEVEKKYFSTTSWFMSSKAIVKDTVRKGYYEIKSIGFDPSRQFPLYAEIEAHRSDVTSGPNHSWCESLTVDWEFLVTYSNQKIWEAGESSTGVHANLDVVYYTGTIPASFSKVRAITKPTSQNTGVIAENQTLTVTGIEKESRQPKDVKIYANPHGEHTVIAEWKIDNESNLTGFSYKFEAKMRGDKRWTHAETGEIDQYQYRKETVSDVFKQTPREREAFHVVNMGKVKGMQYLVSSGAVRTMAEAEKQFELYLYELNWADRRMLDTSNTLTRTAANIYYTPEYQVPDEATEVRVTITPLSPETSGFTELSATPEDTFKFALDEISVNQSNIKATLLSGTRRTVVVTWPKLNDSNTAGYEYRWRYTVNGNSIYFDGETGSISHDAKTLYAQYEAGENVKDLFFSVRPIPKAANDYIGAWSEDVNVAHVFTLFPKKSIQQSSISVVWPTSPRTDKTVYATWGISDWSDADRSKLAGYEVKWRYHIWTDRTENILLEGETQTISDIYVRTDAYTPPDNAVSVCFSVRPVPVNDGDFHGLWSSWVHYHYSIPTRTIKPGSLKVSYSTGTDRSLKISFSKPNNPNNVRDYTCQYYTVVRGIESEPSEITTTRTTFELEAPNDADTIYVRVKPNDTSGNEMYFIGEYSASVSYSLIPGSREIDNIELSLQRGSQTTVVAVWDLDDKKDVDSYSYKWRYRIDKVWFDGTTGSTSNETLACTYDAPAMSDAVEVKVTAVPKYSLAFVGKESEYSIFIMPSSTIPDVPPVPTLSIDKFTLTAFVDSYDEKASMIEFEIITASAIDSTGQADILFNKATFVTEVEAGSGFRARCRAINDEDEASGWSEYTSDYVYSIPLPPSGVPTVNALSATSVEIYWNEVAGATSYVIERTTKSRYFDSAPDLVEETTITSGTRAEIQGLTPRSESDTADGQWYFRIKTVIESQGESEWGEIASIVLGTIPEPPTTWMSTTTPIVNDDLYLYWLHNSEDGSIQSAATMILTINGTAETHQFVNEYEMFEPYDLTSTVTINSSTSAENVVDISQIPEDLRSTSYGGISSLGPNGEYTSRISSTRISGTKLYFTLNNTSGLTTVPVTVSFYLNGLEIQETVDIVTKSGVTHVDRDAKFVLSAGGVSYYLIAGNTYSSGATIKWKVKTRGVVPEFGNYSTERQVTIYTPPTIKVNIGSGYNWLPSDFRFNDENIYPSGTINATSINGHLETFPMILDVHSGPTTQKPLAYVFSITSNDTYEDVDDTGKIMFVRAGQELYKKYIYTNQRDFITLIQANEVNLDNTHNYTFTATVNTDVGLTAETTSKFTVDWDFEEDIELDCEMTFDYGLAVVYLTPSCTNEAGYFINNILLSVYRKEFDGGLTAIAKDIPNAMGIGITDPHPSLDYARYRIVATNLATGRMFFQDLPPQEVGITDIIIQWDEQWTGYQNVDYPNELEEIPYKGSRLALSYNIDESDSNDLDVELVNYIGRKHPVSYYGTHVGQTASWKTDIPKSDKETIYALRRLAIWPGDCYVRAPSGVGYWAHVKVSFDISHLEPIVPVSLDITRVEGGA